ncbi:unnamed protein product, partial [Amoebophrya sp. A25]|eukprot:GSA25T00026086001.1
MTTSFIRRVNGAWPTRPPESKFVFHRCRISEPMGSTRRTLRTLSL